MKRKPAAIIAALLIIVIGVIEVAMATAYSFGGRTQYFYSLYTGLWRFIVGSRPYVSAILAGIIWLVLAVVVFFVVNRSANKKNKEIANQAQEQKLAMIEDTLAAANFTTTSSHDMMMLTGITLTPKSVLRMCVDSNSKRIVFLHFLRNKPPVFINFNKILSCEIVKGGEGSKTSGGAMTGAYGISVGSATTQATLKSLSLRLTMKDIDNPTIEISLVGLTSSSIIELGILQVDGLKSQTPEYIAAMTFVEKAKAVIDSIIANNSVSETTVNQEIPQNTSIDELKKYKDLLDSGILTQEEFDAKKKQLLGL